MTIQIMLKLIQSQDKMRMLFMSILSMYSKVRNQILLRAFKFVISTVVLVKLWL